ncbi:hypothetical protein [Methanocella conradii]|nr:hypothetical protein [Methanocella conradii]MDI6895819.1 hypothetical protein [Methanocella conradii]
MIVKTSQKMAEMVGRPVYMLRRARGRWTTIGERKNRAVDA